MHTFATAHRLMESYPEYRFAYSQPASYAAVDRRAPGLMRHVRRRITEKRWEPTGAMLVESDTLIACGEALARSLVLGQQDFTALRGSPSPLLWLPDVFGYSGCLPQLMRQAGVEWFFTTKLTWSAINRFPHSSFIWRGTDGSEVVAHVTQDVGYNAAVSIKELRDGALGHAQSDVHPEFLQPTGYGDGGGGPTEEMCERARRLAALHGAPAVRWDQPEAFFARLARRRAKLPVWQGECYLEYHRGTYTTHGAVKAAFRALERALQLREAAAVARGTSATACAGLDHAWRRLVFAQFHDYIPGSSVPEVYREGLPELQNLAGSQATAATTALADASGTDMVFNSLPFRHQVCVAGRVLDLPPLAGVDPATVTVTSAPVRLVGRTTLVNGRVRARLDASGRLTSLIIDGTPLALAPGTGDLITYADRAANFEPWDIDRQALSLGEVARAQPTLTATVAPDGSSATITVRRALGRASSVAQHYRLVRGEAALRIELDLDWQEPETLLKLRVATDYRGENVRCGAPFGTVLRSQHPGALAAEAQWEMPASRHLAVTDSGGTAGLWVATEAKYGFGVRDGVVTVSLVRSPRVTGAEGHQKVYPPTLLRTPLDTPYTDLGPHHIKLALGRFDVAAPRAESPAALAESLFTAPIAYTGAPVASALLDLVGGESLLPAWAQPLDANRWVLRLHEVLGQRGTARLVLAPGWSARPVNLLGEPTAATLRNGRVTFRPHQIIGLEISRA